METTDDLQLRRMNEMIDALQPTDRNDPGYMGVVVAATNKLAQMLLRGVPKKMSAFQREQDLAECLGRHTTFKGELRRGMWIIGFEELGATSENISKTRMFEGDRESHLATGSPMIRSLAFIEAARPKFYAFYISLIPDAKLRRDRCSLFGEELKSEFIRAFPIAVRERFRFLASDVGVDHTTTQY